MQAIGGMIHKSMYIELLYAVKLHVTIVSTTVGGEISQLRHSGPRNSGRNGGALYVHLMLELFCGTHHLVQNLFVNARVV